MRGRSQSRLVFLLAVTVILFVFSYININRLNTYKNKNENLNNNLKILQDENSKLSSQKQQLDKKYKEIKNKVSNLKGV
ncbi:hypothetical protein [Clostridium sp. Marseille-Q2269]|uniref:hypothetical protein n=1 Tax=Clostridium sp. Marseille-Q2269 TaxID=2942205 RepID=UPI002073A1A8|nr:hypothetical protein [Clostridium sp. Marseille-Q2269]